MLEQYSGNSLIALNKLHSNGHVLNDNLLESSFSSYHYFSSTKEQICSIFRSIIKNHIFQDGNKRTALSFLLEVCEMCNAQIINDDENFLFDLIIEVATTKIEVPNLTRKLFG